MDVTDACTRSTRSVPPKDWSITPLSEITCEIVDCNHSTPTWTSSGVVVIRNQNIRDGKLDLTNVSYTNEAHYFERVRRAKPSAGDLVITREAPMGQVCMIPLGLRCCLGQRMVLLKIAKDSANSIYVLYALQTDSIQKFMQNAGGTGSTVANLRLPVIRSLPIPTPSQLEQNAIATALSDMDALLDGLDRLISKKRDLKQTAMQQLLTGKTRLPGFRGEWEIKRLGDLAQLSKVGVVPLSAPEKLYTHFSLPSFDAGEKPQIETGASIGSNKFIVPQDAVLLSKLNPRIPRVWAPLEIPPNSVCSTEFLVLIPDVGMDRNFLKYSCMSAHFSSQMELHAIGTTGSHQRTQPNQAMTIEVPVPTEPAEQIAIATVLSDMDAELAALEARRDKTRALKQGMMQELLTGRTRLLKPEPVEPEAAYA